MAKKKEIGSFNRRIVIQEEISERNTHNEDEISGWATFKSVWANVKDEDQFSNREYLVSDQITAKRTLIFTIRYILGVTEKMRISYDGDYFSIVSISKPDFKITLILKAVLLDDLS
jgi:SPP1 family predicted phage head-tail adaptor